MSDDKNKDKKTILVWTDLETTGLQEGHGRGEILEYAFVLTDLELNEIDSIQGIIAHDVDGWLKDCMNEFVWDMHTKNGLIEEIRKISSPGERPFGRGATEITEAMLVGWLMTYQHRDPNVIFVPAGSTVGFDRRWLKAHMPKLEALFHYRQLDVSVYKVGFPEIFGTKTSEAHRAMADIRASIDVHRRMRNIVLSLRDLATK